MTAVRQSHSFRFEFFFAVVLRTAAKEIWLLVWVFHANNSVQMCTVAFNYAHVDATKHHTFVCRTTFPAAPRQCRHGWSRGLLSRNHMHVRDSKSSCLCHQSLRKQCGLLLIPRTMVILSWPSVDYGWKTFLAKEATHYRSLNFQKYWLVILCDTSKMTHRWRNLVLRPLK